MYKNMKKRFELLAQLKELKRETLKMVVGFDGFVDEIIHVVDKRMDSTNYTRIETIEAFAERIARASGLSTNIEFVPQQVKIGGNGPIMCNALSKHDTSISYVGALGFPTIDNVFNGLEDNVSLYSFVNPGHTDAVEFHDGKVMLGKMSSLTDLTYEKLIESIGVDKLVELLSETDLLASVNWSMIPNNTDLWKKLISNILPLLPKKDKKPIFFVDLADPEKRENEEIIEALDLLKEFKENFFVILGLNKKEAYDVADVLNLFDHESLEHMQVALEDLNIALYEYLQVDSVVIHPVDSSCTVVDGVFYSESGPYISKPKLTTGAGDNFNAGFVLGMLYNLKPDLALLTGMSTSGYYVRNAKSPNFKELVEFIDEWANNKI
jgi:hypothetical protein